MSVRWLVADTWTLTLRAFSHWARQPFVLAVGVLFPVLVLLMFAYLLRGGYGDDYPSILVPGLLALTCVFGLETTMTAVVTDASRGITARFRSLPMSGAAVVGGRAVADLVNSLAGLAVLMACGWAIGWRIESGPADALAAVGLLMLLRFSLIWMGIYLGLVAGRPEAVASVQILVWPLGFLSNAFTDPDSMPAWLAAIAEWNPLSATAAAARELFGNPGWGGDSWAATHAVELALAWPILICAVFLPLAVAKYRSRA
ncbi:ABC transporter permease [Solirubrobacter sp. CPCC 204708]|uniref:Transport permease protein n=1 Tax=Solirubrobacter deserti TaxID=2282478 RepID=A0ABT4REY4_9ACTN|nr:ABC transporter permease [Solirubrobacter deserti]MBE2318651.1 ABC transporter permease [Solirubrobacter deserti]MDA0137109.1 ABC transporter permease [Solirubrobacter deserti]